MKVNETDISGLRIVTPEIFEDKRGYFFEAYNQEKFEELGLPIKFVQDNEASSIKGVLRGLHFQNPPHTQGKLVRAVKGEVLNVVIDLRKKSKTYKEYFSIILNEENKKILWIPEGFANGYLTLKNTIYQYECTNFYNKDYERGIFWNDQDLKINWNFEKYNIKEPIISEKDGKLLSLKNIENLISF